MTNHHSLVADILKEPGRLTHAVIQQLVARERISGAVPKLVGEEKLGDVVPAEHEAGFILYEGTGRGLGNGLYVTQRDASGTATPPTRPARSARTGSRGTARPVS